MGFAYFGPYTVHVDLYIPLLNLTCDLKLFVEERGVAFSNENNLIRTRHKSDLLGRCFDIELDKSLVFLNNNTLDSASLQMIALKVGPPLDDVCDNRWRNLAQYMRSRNQNFNRD